MEKNRFKIDVCRYDDMDAFGAYVLDSIGQPENGLILLNIEGSFGACIDNDLSVKELLIEVLMHEVGHALEEWFECEFNEDRIEKIIESYKNYKLKTKKDGTNSINK